MVFLICLNLLTSVLVGVHLEKQNLKKIESLSQSQTHTHLAQESEQLKKNPKRRESDSRPHVCVTHVSCYTQQVCVTDGRCLPPQLSNSQESLPCNSPYLEWELWEMEFSLSKSAHYKTLMLLFNTWKFSCLKKIISL